MCVGGGGGGGGLGLEGSPEKRQCDDSRGPNLYVAFPLLKNPPRT